VKSAAAEPRTPPTAAPTVVFMFPGQSSRYPEMIEKVTAGDRESQAIVACASDILGRDLAMHYRGANAAMFDRNRDVQIGVFLANHLHLCRLESVGIRGDLSLGLSLGEYNHLVHIGALSFEAALRLIDERGRLYDEGPEGVMVSVFPIEAEPVEEAIDSLELRGRVAIGLYNSPRQQVLTGERAAVERLIAALDAEMLIDAVEIETRIPMHAPIFEPVATRFGDVLARAQITAARLPHVPNFRGAISETADPDEIRQCLLAHVWQPVHWLASIDALAKRAPGACFVEVGPGGVLYNLFGRGWMPGRRARTDSAEAWRDYLPNLAAELCDGR
jgi:[acyl-carrier-protein] S-malonyltransferase